MLKLDRSLEINQRRLGDWPFDEAFRGPVTRSTSCYPCLGKRHIAESCIILPLRKAHNAC